MREYFRDHKEKSDRQGTYMVLYLRKSRIALSLHSTILVFMHALMRVPVNETKRTVWKRTLAIIPVCGIIDEPPGRRYGIALTI